MACARTQAMRGLVALVGCLPGAAMTGGPPRSAAWPRSSPAPAPPSRRPAPLPPVWWLGCPFRKGGCAQHSSNRMSATDRLPPPSPSPPAGTGPGRQCTGHTSRRMSWRGCPFKPRSHLFNFPIRSKRLRGFTSLSPHRSANSRSRARPSCSNSACAWIRLDTSVSPADFSCAMAHMVRPLQLSHCAAGLDAIGAMGHGAPATCAPALRAHFKNPSISADRARSEGSHGNAPVHICGERSKRMHHFHAWIG